MSIKRLFPPIRRIYFVLAAISLICGTAVYILFRDSDLLVWTVLPRPAFWDMWKIPINYRSNFITVLAGSAPDCLWLLSGIFALRGLWFFELKTQTMYVLVFNFIALSYNMGQYLGIVPGTFDYFDLLTMLSVALAEGIIFFTFIKRRIQDDEEKF